MRGNKILHHLENYLVVGTKVEHNYIKDPSIPYGHTSAHTKKKKKYMSKHAYGGLFVVT